MQTTFQSLAYIVSEFKNNIKKKELTFFFFFNNELLLHLYFKIIHPNFQVYLQASEVFLRKKKMQYLVSVNPKKDRVTINRLPIAFSLLLYLYGPYRWAIYSNTGGIPQINITIIFNELFFLKK